MKQKTILIPNATGPSNLGDVAILQGLLKLIEESFPDAKIIIHSSESQLHRFKQKNITVDETLYSWAVFLNHTFWVRSSRMIKLFLAYLAVSFGVQFKSSTPGTLSKLLADYASADLILFVGGGYLRSQPKLTQSLNLIGILLPFWFANRFNVSKILTPMSFGPFAHSWQEKLSANALKKLDIVGLREQVSVDLLSKYHLNNIVLGPDFALWTEKIQVFSVKFKTVLGFTVREWFKNQRQAEFEKEFVAGLTELAREKKLTIQPIVQVNGSFGDEIVTERIVQQLKDFGLEVLPTIMPSDIHSALHTYNQLDLLLRTRMHSNILAATQDVPFVAIAYEHKTDGIAQILGMGDYVIKIENFSRDQLLGLMQKAFDNIGNLKQTIKESIAPIRQNEFETWQRFLRQYV